jgi:hypothetical protein
MNANGARGTSSPSARDSYRKSFSSAFLGSRLDRYRKFFSSAFVRSRLDRCREFLLIGVRPFTPRALQKIFSSSAFVCVICGYIFARHRIRGLSRNSPYVVIEQLMKLECRQRRGASPPSALDSTVAERFSSSAFLCVIRGYIFGSP